MTTEPLQILRFSSREAILKPTTDAMYLQWLNSTSHYLSQTLHGHYYSYRLLPSTTVVLLVCLPTDRIPAREEGRVVTFVAPLTTILLTGAELLQHAAWSKKKRI